MLDFNILSSTTGSDFSVFIGTDDLGTFNYNETNALNLPADGSQVTLVFIDNTSACQIEQIVGPLNSCSTNCQIEFDVLDIVCDGNGTNSDPSDDFYTITISASAVNGSTNNTYNVLIDGVLQFNYTYETQESFTLPADGSSPIITIVDNEDAQCQNNMTIGPLNSCSSECVLDYMIENIICDNLGTENDALDDEFYFDLIVTGVNNGVSWYEENNSFSADYNETITLGPYLIADGNLVLNLIDIDNSDCSIDLLVEAPASCSSPCEIVLNSLTVGPCQDNNTGNITTDDVFDLEFEIVVNLGTTNQFQIEIDGVQYGPFMYGSVITIPNLPADGNTYTASVVDITFGQCTTSFEYTAPVPCSSCDQSVEAGMDVILDCNQTSTQLVAVPSEAGAQFEWTGPNFFFSDEADPEVGAPGVYTVIASFDDGCTALDSVEVSVDDAVPVSNAGPDLFLTCVVEDVLVEAIITNTENILIEWTDAQGNLITNNNSFLADSLGSYYLQLTDTINNCSSALDEMQILDNTDEPIAIIYADPTNVIDCTVEEVSLSNEMEENVVYTWLFDNVVVSGENIVVTQQGTVQIIALDTINGCENEAFLDITDVEDYPIVAIDAVDTLDCVNDIVNITASGSQTGVDIIYEWLDINNNVLGNSIDLDVTSGGTYYLQLTDTLNGCSNIDSVMVESFIELPSIEAGEDQFLDCGESSTVLLAIVDGNLNDFDINWSTDTGTILSGQSGLMPMVEGSGLYILNVFNTITSCESTDTVFVSTIEDVPEASLLSNIDESCQGDGNGILIIENVVGGTPPYMYSLDGQNFQNNDSFENLDPGNYSVFIIDANGCGIDTSAVILEGGFVDLNVEAEITLNQGETTQVFVDVNIPQELIDNIEWSPSNGLDCSDCLDPIVTGESDQIYTVTVTDVNGCTDIASFALTVPTFEVIPDVYIPNVFSPNGDNNGNDLFTLYGNENVERINEMYIFDRWGELVFQTFDIPPNDPSFGWDGHFKNEPVEQGVYVYLFNVKYVDQRVEDISGDVTVLR